MVAAPTTTNLPSLKNGDSGESVRFLEQLLSSIFWFSSLRPQGPKLISTNVTFDGKYDGECEKIVKEFQKNYNSTFPAPAPTLQVDGEIGPETWKALGDAIFRYTYGVVTFMGST